MISSNILNNKRQKKNDYNNNNNNNLEKQLSNFNILISKDGEKIVKELFPRKILEFNELLNKVNLSDSNIINNVLEQSLINNIPNRLNINNIIVPCNKKLVELLNILKEEILSSVQVIGTVKVWIQLLIPRIESGNNFGVSVQVFL